MSEEKDFIYDDEEAVKFIKNYLPQDLKSKFSDDNINYIIDLIYEFYESKGLLDGDDNSMVEFDEEELIEFVIKNAQRDGFGKYSPDEITYIVQGELAYCDSIELFE